VTYHPSPLEVILTDPQYFGLKTATRAQRAICRIADGWSLPPAMLKDRTVQNILGRGHNSSELVVPPRQTPSQLLLIAAIRTFKSLLAAAVAIRSALFSDLSVIGEGEAHAKVFILSNDRKNAQAVFDHLLGKVQTSPALQGRVAKPPTAESIVLKRDDGKVVEIEVRAAKKGGTGVVGRWLCAAIFDEVTFMLGEDDGAASLDASLAQCVGRIVPGGQIVMIGSSYAPPRGPAYEMLMGNWGRPSPELVALWATGPELNPVAYSKKNCLALVKAGRDKARAYLTRQFRDPATGFISPDLVDDAIRKGVHVIPPEDGHVYVAATDPATVKNVWTLIILDTVSGCPVRYRVVLAMQWVPEDGQRLRPSVVIKESAGVVKPYGIDTIYSDHHMQSALADMAEAEGIAWSGEQSHGKEKADLYIELGRVFNDRLIEIPPDPYLRRDLISVRKHITQDNTPQFVLTKTPDGRHCDYVPAFARALKYAPEPALDGSEKAKRSQEDEMWDELIEAGRKRSDDGVLAAMERL